MSRCTHITAEQVELLKAALEDMHPNNHLINETYRDIDGLLRGRDLRLKDDREAAEPPQPPPPIRSTVLEPEAQDMRLFHFQGNSDDTFGCEAIDHDNCANGEPIRFKLVRPNGEGVIVTGCYSATVYNLGQGCWMIGVEALDENRPLSPAWHFSLNPSHEGYRNQLAVQAPGDTEVHYLPTEDQSEGESF